MEDNTKFSVIGHLVLESQEGGFASDAFMLDNEELDDMVADYFNAKRESTGNRYIGKVRITIKRID